MLGKLWDDNSGEISEYALILSMILVLGIGVISRTGKALHDLYQAVSSQQANSGTTAPLRPPQ
jgi:Flp pilus assembly pilin Flp